MIQMKEAIRNQLVQIRCEKGMTQEWLAHKLGVDPSCLSKWERGVNNFPLEIIPAYAKALGLTIQFNSNGEFVITSAQPTLQIPEDYETFSVERVKKAMETADAFQQEVLETLQKKLNHAQLALFSQNQSIIDCDQIAQWSANDYLPDHVFYLKSTDETCDHAISIQCDGYLDAQSFDLHGLLEALKTQSSYATMKEVEKAFYYACVFESRGFEVLRWASHSDFGEREQLETQHLFPYLSTESFEALMELMKSRSWIRQHDTFYPSDISTLSRLNLVQATNEKEWLIRWLDSEEAIELDDVLFGLDDAILIAIDEWMDRF